MKQKQINQNWIEFKLGEITECLDNQRIPITASDRKRGGVSYYGANGKQDSIDDFIFDEELLLLAEDGGSWGYKQKCSYVIFGKSWVNNHAHVLQMKKDMINIKLLMYWFNLTDLNKYISGTTRGKLNQGIMKKIKISLPILPDGTPDLKKQKQIVAILGKVEGLKDKRKGLDELFDEYLKSIFYEMFLKEKGKFEQVELGDSEYFKTQSGGTPSKGKDEYWKNGNIPWIGSTECKDSRVFFAKKFITQLGLDNSSTKIFSKGTILVALVGATIGKTGILEFDCSTNQNIAGIEILDKRRVDNLYLFFSLQNLYNQFISLSSDSFKMATLSFVRSLKIPLPPIALQEKFASIVEKVEKVKDKLKDEKKDADELFNALMQKAFSGELV